MEGGQRACGRFNKMTAESERCEGFCASAAISLCLLLPPRELFAVIGEL